MNVAKRVKPDLPTLALDEAAVLTSHTEAGAWDAADVARFQVRHPGVVTEQEAEAALARLERSYTADLGDVPAAGEADITK
ncbi:MAG: hypothetical protein M1401_18660 [Chloroflexi bacterium]|nr:hypothetical protein [Chloroflexota bacterium]MCL5110842.1 hypothetical protein [Chloroflexota bacterium]